MENACNVITACKWSLGQGNIFTSICLSTGGVSAFRGVCIGGIRWRGLPQGKGMVVGVVVIVVCDKNSRPQYLIQNFTFCKKGQLLLLIEDPFSENPHSPAAASSQVPPSTVTKISWLGWVVICVLLRESSEGWLSSQTHTHQWFP